MLVKAGSVPASTKVPPPITQRGYRLKAKVARALLLRACKYAAVSTSASEASSLSPVLSIEDAPADLLQEAAELIVRIGIPASAFAYVRRVTRKWRDTSIVCVDGHPYSPATLRPKRSTASTTSTSTSPSASGGATAYGSLSLTPSGPSSGLRITDTRPVTRPLLTNRMVPAPGVRRKPVDISKKPAALGSDDSSSDSDHPVAEGVDCDADDDYDSPPAASASGGGGSSSSAAASSPIPVPTHAPAPSATDSYAAAVEAVVSSGAATGNDEEDAVLAAVLAQSLLDHTEHQQRQRADSVAAATAAIATAARQEEGAERIADEWEAKLRAAVAEGRVKLNPASRGAAAWLSDAIGVLDGGSGASSGAGAMPVPTSADLSRAGGEDVVSALHRAALRTASIVSAGSGTTSGASTPDGTHHSQRNLLSAPQTRKTAVAALTKPAVGGGSGSGSGGAAASAAMPATSAPATGDRRPSTYETTGGASSPLPTVYVAMADRFHRADIVPLHFPPGVEAPPASLFLAQRESSVTFARIREVAGIPRGWTGSHTYVAASMGGEEYLSGLRPGTSSSPLFYHPSIGCDDYPELKRLSLLEGRERTKAVKDVEADPSRAVDAPLRGKHCQCQHAWLSDEYWGGEIVTLRVWRRRSLALPFGARFADVHHVSIDKPEEGKRMATSATHTGSSSVHAGCELVGTARIRVSDIRALQQHQAMRMKATGTGTGSGNVVHVCTVSPSLRPGQAASLDALASPPRPVPTFTDGHAEDEALRETRRALSTAAASTGGSSATAPSIGPGSGSKRPPASAKAKARKVVTRSDHIRMQGPYALRGAVSGLTGEEDIDPGMDGDGDGDSDGSFEVNDDVDGLNYLLPGFRHSPSTSSDLGGSDGWVDAPLGFDRISTNRARDNLLDDGTVLDRYGSRYSHRRSYDSSGSRSWVPRELEAEPGRRKYVDRERRLPRDAVPVTIGTAAPVGPASEAALRRLVGRKLGADLGLGPRPTSSPAQDPLSLVAACIQRDTTRYMHALRCMHRAWESFTTNNMGNAARLYGNRTHVSRDLVDNYLAALAEMAGTAAQATGTGTGTSSGDGGASARGGGAAAGSASLRTRSSADAKPSSSPSGGDDKGKKEAHPGAHINEGFAAALASLLTHASTAGSAEGAPPRALLLGLASLLDSERVRPVSSTDPHTGETTTAASSVTPPPFRMGSALNPLPPAAATPHRATVGLPRVTASYANHQWSTVGLGIRPPVHLTRTTEGEAGAAAEAGHACGHACDHGQAASLQDPLLLDVWVSLETGAAGRSPTGTPARLYPVDPANPSTPPFAGPAIRVNLRNLLGSEILEPVGTGTSAMLPIYWAAASGCFSMLPHLLAMFMSGRTDMGVNSRGVRHIYAPANMYANHVPLRPDGLSPIDLAALGSTNDHARCAFFLKAATGTPLTASQPLTTMAMLSSSSKLRDALNIYTATSTISDSLAPVLPEDVVRTMLRVPSRTTLHMAVLGGNLRMLEMTGLRRMGKQVDALGQTPFQLALAAGRTRIAALLAGEAGWTPAIRLVRPLLAPSSSRLGAIDAGMELAAVRLSDAAEAELKSVRQQRLLRSDWTDLSSSTTGGFSAARFLNRGARLAATSTGDSRIGVDRTWMLGPQTEAVRLGEGGFPVLFQTVASLQAGATMLLLQYGFDPATRSAGQCVPFLPLLPHASPFRGSPIEQAAAVTSVPLVPQDTALHILVRAAIAWIEAAAAASAPTAFVEVLLPRIAFLFALLRSLGLHVADTNHDGDSPLHIAAAASCAQVIALLTVLYGSSDKGGRDIPLATSTSHGLGYLLGAIARACAPRSAGGDDQGAWFVQPAQADGTPNGRLGDLCRRLEALGPRPDAPLSRAASVVNARGLTPIQLLSQAQADPKRAAQASVCQTLLAPFAVSHAYKPPAPVPEPSAAALEAAAPAGRGSFSDVNESSPLVPDATAALAAVPPMPPMPPTLRPTLSREYSFGGTSVVVETSPVHPSPTLSAWTAPSTTTLASPPLTIGAPATAASSFNADASARTSAGVAESKEDDGHTSHTTRAADASPTHAASTPLASSRSDRDGLRHYEDAQLVPYMPPGPAAAQIPFRLPIDFDKYSVRCRECSSQVPLSLAHYSPGLMAVVCPTCGSVERSSTVLRESLQGPCEALHLLQPSDLPNDGWMNQGRTVTWGDLKIIVEASKKKSASHASAAGVLTLAVDGAAGNGPAKETSKPVMEAGALQLHDRVSSEGPGALFDAVATAFSQTAHGAGGTAYEVLSRKQVDSLRRLLAVQLAASVSQALQGAAPAGSATARKVFVSPAAAAITMLACHGDANDAAMQLLARYGVVNAKEPHAVGGGAAGSTSTTASSCSAVLIQVSDHDASAATEDPDELVMCEACMDDVPSKDMIRLQECGHRFCPNCWRGHLEASMAKHGGRCVLETQCLTRPDCMAIVDETIWATAMPKEAYARYWRWSVDTFARQAPELAACGNPVGCDMFVYRPPASAHAHDGHGHGHSSCTASVPHSLVERVTAACHSMALAMQSGSHASILRSFQEAIKTAEAAMTDNGRAHAAPLAQMDVRCACGYAMCFDCSLASHAPASCRTVQNWRDAVTAVTDSASISFMSSNFKKCPFCGAYVSKNGGCRHMTCGNCHREFCWICGAVWNGYGHRCAYFGSAAPKGVAAWNAAKHSDGEKKALHFDGADMSAVEEEELGQAPSHRTKKGADKLLSVQKQLGVLSTAQDMVEERLKSLSAPDMQVKALRLLAGMTAPKSGSADLAALMAGASSSSPELPLSLRLGDELLLTLIAKSKMTGFPAFADKAPPPPVSANNNNGTTVASSYFEDRQSRGWFSDSRWLRDIADSWERLAWAAYVLSYCDDPAWVAAVEAGNSGPLVGRKPVIDVEVIRQLRVAPNYFNSTPRKMPIKATMPASATRAMPAWVLEDPVALKYLRAADTEANKASSTTTTETGYLFALAIQQGACTGLLKAMQQPTFVCFTCMHTLGQNKMRGCSDCSHIASESGPENWNMADRPDQQHMYMERMRICLSCAAHCHRGHSLRFEGFLRIACGCARGFNTAMHTRLCERHHNAALSGLSSAGRDDLAFLNEHARSLRGVKPLPKSDGAIASHMAQIDSEGFYASTNGLNDLQAGVIEARWRKHGGCLGIVPGMLAHYNRLLSVEEPPVRSGYTPKPKFEKKKKVKMVRPAGASTSSEASPIAASTAEDIITLQEALGSLFEEPEEAAAAPLTTASTAASTSSSPGASASASASISSWAAALAESTATTLASPSSSPAHELAPSAAAPSSSSAPPASPAAKPLVTTDLLLARHEAGRKVIALAHLHADDRLAKLKQGVRGRMVPATSSRSTPAVSGGAAGASVDASSSAATSTSCTATSFIAPAVDPSELANRCSRLVVTLILIHRLFGFCYWARVRAACLPAHSTSLALESYQLSMLGDNLAKLLSMTDLSAGWQAVDIDGAFNLTVASLKLCSAWMH